MFTLVSPLLLNGVEFTLPVAKNVALFETVRVLRFASVKCVCERKDVHAWYDTAVRCWQLSKKRLCLG